MNKKSIASHSFYAVLIAFVLLFVSPSFAQDKADDNSWDFTIAPYLMFPNMNGNVALGAINVDVSAGSSDIFSNLDFGAMLYFEASNPKWTIIFDLLYMDLSSGGVTPFLSREVGVQMDQLAIASYGMYRLNSWMEVGIGGRYNSIGTTLDIASGEVILPGNKFSMDQTWFDPLIVARAIKQFDDSKWRIGMLVDIGGFGIGSDFAWQVNPTVGYRFSNLFEMALAYRWLSMDYNTGEGIDYFLYDMTISGPEIGFLFHF